LQSIRKSLYLKIFLLPLIEDITHGWIVLNIWHNAQYILFVWMYNNKRFKNKIDQKHTFLSTLCLNHNQWLYYCTCLTISSFFYFYAIKIIKIFSIQTFTWNLLIFQTINFHHYIVDGIIWKIKKKPIQMTLGIKGENIE